MTIQLHWHDLIQQQREAACETADCERGIAYCTWLQIADWLKEDLIAAHEKLTGNKETINR